MKPKSTSELFLQGAVAQWSSRTEAQMQEGNVVESTAADVRSCEAVGLRSCLQMGWISDAIGSEGTEQ